jgi:hypothetical protein
METKSGFDFQKFINDSRDVLLNPKDFFSRIELTGGMGEPLLKALIYGAIAGLFSMLWSFMNIGGLFGSATGIGLFFTTLIGALIGALIMGVIVLIFSSICGGNTDYEPNFRVAVAIMVILPISTFLNVISGLSGWLGTLVSLAVNLYALYVLYFGLFVALKGKESSAKVLGFVLAGILIFFMLIGAISHRAARRLSGYGSKQFERHMKDFEKAAKKIEKEATAHYGEVLKELEGIEEQVAKIGESIEDADVTSVDPIAKPDPYPTDAIEFAKEKEWFSQKESDFSRKTISSLIDMIKELREFDKSQEAEMLEVMKNYGYEDLDKYQYDVNKTLISHQALKGLESLQIIISSSEKEQTVAEFFTLDQAIEGLVKQSLEAGDLTIEDMRVAYDNWDLLTEFNEITRRK